jgi:UDP-N-acetylmuramate--alanine ligase
MKHKIKHIHFIGIGGAGMSGIAQVLLHLGYHVSGSDILDSATVKALSKIGATIFIGHRAAWIKKADVVVFSSAIEATNPELQAAIHDHIPVVPRAMMLAELMRFKQGIAIAGTHGKTTTTSLTASVLAAAKLDPTFIIGGKLLTVGSNAQLGLGEFMLVEADESDASFLYLNPIISVVTNIDSDHMDTYDHDFDKLKQAFIDFLNRLPFYGRAILCLEDQHVGAILPSVTRPVTTYGLSTNANIYAKNIQSMGMQTYFDVVVKDMHGHKIEDSFSVKLNMPGTHNLLNALAAIGVGLECGVNKLAIQSALENFSGVYRRFQNYGEIPIKGGQFTLIDDYAHHPVEIKATILAIRRAFVGKRLLLIFQPHRYTRTRDLFEDFVHILSSVDVLILAEVYAANEEPLIASDGQALARAITIAGKIEPLFVELLEAIPQKLFEIVKAGDIVVTMGAGSIGIVPSKIVAMVK